MFISHLLRMFFRLFFLSFTLCFRVEDEPARARRSTMAKKNVEINSISLLFSFRRLGEILSACPSFFSHVIFLGSSPHRLLRREIRARSSQGLHACRSGVWVRRCGSTYIAMGSFTRANYRFNFTRSQLITWLGNVSEHATCKRRGHFRFTIFVMSFQYRLIKNKILKWGRLVVKLGNIIQRFATRNEWATRWNQR